MRLRMLFRFFNLPISLRNLAIQIIYLFYTQHAATCIVSFLYYRGWVCIICHGHKDCYILQVINFIISPDSFFTFSRYNKRDHNSGPQGVLHARHM